LSYQISCLASIIIIIIIIIIIFHIIDNNVCIDNSATLLNYLVSNHNQLRFFNKRENNFLMAFSKNSYHFDVSELVSFKHFLMLLKFLHDLIAYVKMKTATERPREREGARGSERERESGKSLII